MGRIYFADVCANNFHNSWNNSTECGEILDMSKIQIHAKFETSRLYNLAVINI